MSPELEATTALFNQHIPINTTIIIETNVCRFGAKYVFRLRYTSPNSGRTMCMVAKGDVLPTLDDEHLHFYLRQLVLTPKEASIEFARLYWREKNARQTEFLAAGKLSNIRVSDSTASKDKSLTFGELTV